MVPSYNYSIFIQVLHVMLNDYGRGRREVVRARRTEQVVFMYLGVCVMAIKEKEAIRKRKVVHRRSWRRKERGQVM